MPGKIDLETIAAFQEKIFQSNKIPPTQIKTAEQYCRELKYVIDKNTEHDSVIKASKSLRKKLEDALSKERIRQQIRSGEVTI